MRAVRFLLIVIVVLGGLFVAADRIAVSVAESKAAERTRQSQGLSAKPEVSIKGFPFLTQVAAGRLDEVRVTARGLQADDGKDKIRIDRLTADLHGVRLSDGYRRAVADTAGGTVLITYADLSAAAPHGVSVAYGGPAQDGTARVKVTGAVALPVIGTVRRSVISEVRVRGGDTVTLHARSVPGAEAFPGLEKLIRQKIDFTGTVAGLPRGIALDSVTATPDGITVAVTGTDVVLAD